MRTIIQDTEILTMDDLMKRLWLKSRPSLKFFLDKIETLIWKKWKDSKFFFYPKWTKSRRIKKESIKELIKLHKAYKKDKMKFFLLVNDLKN